MIKFIPQMSPMDWLILSMFFLLIYFLSFLIIYFLLYLNFQVFKDNLKKLNLNNFYLKW